MAITHMDGVERTGSVGEHGLPVYIGGASGDRWLAGFSDVLDDLGALFTDKVGASLGDARCNPLSSGTVGEVCVFPVRP